VPDLHKRLPFICEIALSTFRANEALYPETRYFGESTASSLKDYGLDWSHFNLLARLRGCRRNCSRPGRGNLSKRNLGIEDRKDKGEAPAGHGCLWIYRCCKKILGRACCWSGACWMHPNHWRKMSAESIQSRSLRTERSLDRQKWREG